LRGITEEVAAIRELEQSGDLEAALEMVNALLEARPENRFLLGKQAALEAQLRDQEFQRLVAESVDFEAADDLESAIASLKSALDLKADPAQSERLARLESVFQARQLERLLADGFAALEAARYEEARDLYRAATDLAPDSEEAQTGLEKASSLYLAEIRYRQNLGAAARYIEDGRFPLAARLFNEAMTSRPNAVAPEQAAAEEDIRQTLEAQSEEVTVTLRSDRRSFVSVIGVQAPDRFRERELRLFPDVYKVRATRSGYRTVEMDLKVDATQPPPTLTVECTERL
jgi:tetratricopeptide (TPR) repeat protein